VASHCKAIVVGASGEELAHVRQCLSDWECATAFLNEEETAVSSIPPGAKPIIVYARKDQKNTLAICEQLRDSPENAALPILLVIRRYELPQGNAVQRMGNATFIMVPFDEEELPQTAKELLESS